MAGQRISTVKGGLLVALVATDLIKAKIPIAQFGYFIRFDPIESVSTSITGVLDTAMIADISSIRACIRHIRPEPARRSSAMSQLKIQHLLHDPHINLIPGIDTIVKGQTFYHPCKYAGRVMQPTAPGFS